MTKKIKVGIIGGAGYTAGELLRLLINHPQVEIAWINSQSQAGLPITHIHGGLLGETTLLFTDEIDLEGIDTLFLCSGHGESTRFWSEHKRPASLNVIDLAQDFRDESNGYIYGLPELNRQRLIDSAKCNDSDGNGSLVANPGCFATALQLSLLPLASAQLLTDDIHVTAVTGSTGAGVKPGATTHFSWRSDNISVYKPFSHQHIPEVTRSITKLQPSFDKAINFVPVRGDFARGIFASVYTKVSEMTTQQLASIYENFYQSHPFAVVSDRAIDLKQAVNTNKAIIHVEMHGDIAHITTAIDNLLKGASGQALHNFNLIHGLVEKTGLALKPSAF